jgi:hypothetical protein
MNKVAIAFSTKDRVNLTRRTIEPLLQPDKFDLFWMDGSTSQEGMMLQRDYPDVYKVYGNVRGGADTAIVFMLTELLNHPNNYSHVGLVENDVLLHPDFFGPMMALFERGAADGLHVGDVSARLYQDRILFQRDGYVVQHNSGAGMVMFTREAARLVLTNCRSAWSTDNRRIFAKLSGRDIGKWWAFRGLTQWLTFDWHFEVILAQHGLASLALCPNLVEMIGQELSMEDQGLRYVTEPMELHRDDKKFEMFVERMRQVREGTWVPEQHIAGRFLDTDGTWMIFPHQVQAMGGVYSGAWCMHRSQGFGPFSWIAEMPTTGDDFAKLEVPVSGPAYFLVSGGKHGGKCEIVDLESGYEITPELPPEGPTTSVAQVFVPASVSYRKVLLTAFTPGVTFFGIRTRDPQPYYPDIKFDYSFLPPVK